MIIRLGGFVALVETVFPACHLHREVTEVMFYCERSECWSESGGCKIWVLLKNHLDGNFRFICACLCVVLCVCGGGGVRGGCKRHMDTGTHANGATSCDLQREHMRL